MPRTMSYDQASAAFIRLSHDNLVLRRKYFNDPKITNPLSAWLADEKITIQEKSCQLTSATQNNLAS